MRSAPTATASTCRWTTPNSSPPCTLACMLVGYLAGLVLIPRFVSQERYLGYSAVLGVVLAIGAFLTHGYVSVGFVAALGFANAMMWPAIFPLAIRGLGRFTEMGSALLIMGIAGGAIIPQLFAVLKQQMISSWCSLRWWCRATCTSCISPCAVIAPACPSRHDGRGNHRQLFGTGRLDVRRPTIKDVAERAKVSLKTVSRVINNEPSVMQTTRSRVLHVIAELDYEPDPSARNLRSATLVRDRAGLRQPEPVPHHRRAERRARGLPRNRLRPADPSLRFEFAAARRRTRRMGAPLAPRRAGADRADVRVARAGGRTGRARHQAGAHHRRHRGSERRHSLRVTSTTAMRRSRSPST